MPKKKSSKMNKRQAELYTELKKLAKRANQRIVRIEKEFGRKDSWAVKKLRNRLDIIPLQAWTEKGRVKVSKKFTVGQLRQIIKSTKQFLKSKTSTVSGIKKVIREQKQNIKDRLKDEEFDIDEEEAELFYEMIADESSQYFIDRMGYSEFTYQVEEAKQMEDTEEEFISRIRRYIDFGNDLDVIDKLKKVYERYVL